MPDLFATSLEKIEDLNCGGGRVNHGTLDARVGIGCCFRSACMNDTLPEIERMVREKIMARSNEERFVMGAEMFDAARIMLCASFPTDLPEAERKHRLFERLYGKS